MDESIKLDRKSFEALAGQTRVKALKSLLKRRKTLTELSEELQLSPSTMKEHLDVLMDSELIAQIDEGRKWKYYELTRKGKQIAEPHELRVWIILGLSIIAAASAIFNLLYAFEAPVHSANVFAEAAPAGGGLMLGATAPVPQAVPTAGESAAATADRNVGIAEAAGGSPPEQGAAASTESSQEKSASFEEAQPPVPFMQVGIAAAGVLILTWAVFYARGEGVL